MKRVPYEVMVNEFERVLTKYGFEPKDAKASAELFAQNSMAGVYSHGLNRFPRVVEYLKKGEIDPKVKAEKIMGFGAFERWDGHRGFGPLNAKLAMDRAVELAKEFGMGIVALGNNNHWMRGGTYGWQAADAGCIGICWSNTAPNMPAWGAKDCRIGNNPLILAVPRSDGQHVMVDCALSQFSYGKLESTRLAGKQLPVPGGYGEGGQLTEAVRRQPYSVVLFDEIEKAHPEVFNSMLQIFDEGHLTDGSGRKVDFRNTIIIMTSNVGSRNVVQKSVQVGYSTVSKSATAVTAPQCEYRKALEQTFAPEFLNRIDDIVLFRTLEISDVERIIELELQGLFERTRRLGYKVKITDGAKRRLAAMGYESRYGVRSLKRTLMDNVEEPLSALIIDGKLHEGDTVVVESDKAHGVRIRVA